jgi:hypothetical protein
MLLGRTTQMCMQSFTATSNRSAMFDYRFRVALAFISTRVRTTLIASQVVTLAQCPATAERDRRPECLAGVLPPVGLAVRISKVGGRASDG